MFKTVVVVISCLFGSSVYAGELINIAGAEVTAVRAYETSDNSSLVLIELDSTHSVGVHPDDDSINCSLWTGTKQVADIAMSAKTTGYKVNFAYEAWPEKGQYFCKPRYFEVSRFPIESIPSGSMSLQYLEDAIESNRSLITANESNILELEGHLDQYGEGAGLATTISRTEPFPDVINVNGGAYYVIHAGHHSSVIGYRHPVTGSDPSNHQIFFKNDGDFHSCNGQGCSEGHQPISHFVDSGKAFKFLKVAAS